MFFPIGDDNPSSRKPVVTYGLIAANLLAFVVANGWPFRGLFGVLPQEVAENLGLRPWDIRRDLLGNLYMFGTSMFLHGDLMHLLGNMLFLWIVGDNVEDKLGRWRFAAFYLGSGVFASASYLLYAGLMSPVPLVGASGAIAGAMGCYLVFFPRARIRIFYWFYFFIGTFMVEARWAIGFWIVENLFMMAVIPSTFVSGVAYAAHVGGFAVGVGLGMLVKGRLRGASGINRVDQLTGFAARGQRVTAKRVPRPGPTVIDGAAEDRRHSEFVSPRVQTQRDDEGFFGLEEAISSNVREGRIDAALDRYGDYLRMKHAKPLPAWAQIEIAAELFRRKDYEGALKAYRRYLAHSPSGADAPEAKFRLGMILSRHRNEFFRAREYLLQAVMEHPDRDTVTHAREELDRIKPLI